MSVTELIESAQFVVDAQGNKKAVVLDFSIWQAILPLLERLEELEDLADIDVVAAAYEAYKQDPATVRPWNEIEAELINEGLLDE